MIKRVFVLMPLIIGLMMFSCSLQEPAQDTELQFEDIVKMEDFNTAESEVQNVVTLTMNFAFESWEAHQEVVEMQVNASSLAKTASDWEYTWNGNVHSWAKTEADDAFFGEFYKEVYYVNEDNQLVANPDEAFYMFTINRAKGKYGFVGDETDSQYGVTFSHVLSSKWFDMQSSDRYMTAQGNYTKTNRLIYNGKDALLKYYLKIQIDQLSFVQVEGTNEFAVLGNASIDMKPWTVNVECNGTKMAEVTVMDGKRLYDRFEYDLTNVLMSGMGVQ